MKELILFLSLFMVPRYYVHANILHQSWSVTVISQLRQLIKDVEVVIPPATACSGLKFPSETCQSFIGVRTHPLYNLLNFTSLYQKYFPVLINNICFTKHSFGNDLGLYLESYLCARTNGINYVAPYFLDPIGGLELEHLPPFLDTLPKLVQLSQQNISMYLKYSSLKDRVYQTCRADMFPWRQENALIHRNIPVIRDLLSESMQAQWEAIDKKMSLVLGYHDITWTSNKSSDISGMTTSSTASSRKKHFQNDSDPIFPFLPDVVIHYRCSDNTAVGGLLPFLTIKQTLMKVRHRIQFVYILSEDTKRSKTVTFQQRRCGVILENLLQYLGSSFTKTSFALLRGHDLFDDLIRLAKTKTIICSASTFCLWPALATNGTAYLPLSNLFSGGKAVDYGSHVRWIRNVRLVFFPPHTSDLGLDWFGIVKRLTHGTKVIFD